MATTGERIRDARKALGMTQTELADKVGVKYSAIHKYETGLIVNLKRETISALAQALNVSPAWLMCMDDEDDGKKPAAQTDSELLDAELIRRLCELTPEELQIVDAVVQGLIAKR